MGLCSTTNASTHLELIRYINRHGEGAGKYVVAKIEKGCQDKPGHSQDLADPCSGSKPEIVS